jgi:hypothetical protein
MRRFRWATLLVAAATVASVPGIASAAEVADASCPGPGTVGNSASGDHQFAQTFTAIHTGALTRAQIEVFDFAPPAGSGDYVVSIHVVNDSGIPTTTVLATTSVPNPAPTDEVRTIEAIFDSPLQVATGHQYALVVSRPGSLNMNVRTRDGDPCAGGGFYTRSGDTFIPSGNLDLVYAIFIATPDTDPPKTRITKRPPNRGASVNARFRFRSNEAGSIFECKLKGPGLRPGQRQYRQCTSPKRYRNLKPGTHRFKVRATDSEGNVDQSPARDRFRVLS